MAAVFDALVIGVGPAGLILTAELCDRGLQVANLAPNSASAPWPNTYGVWVDELEALGLTELLGHHWKNSVSYFGPSPTRHPRDYGLFDKEKFQQYLLQRCQTVTWILGKAGAICHGDRYSTITPTNTQADCRDVPASPVQARIVIDASGHFPALSKRPAKANVAYQAAYGIVGRFSQPPVEPGQFVLMDFRADHLSAAERQQPPTFSYEMDLGDGIHFVEETSLALAPAMGFDQLQGRMEKRLAARGIEILEAQHIERCLFPMNLPLPDRSQSLVAFGGASSMVHPASGYMVGAMLRRGPELGAAIARALQDPKASPQAIARQGWEALWSRDRLRKHYLYLFGLNALMGFEAARLNNHFSTFFNLPQSHWSGFLADTLTSQELVGAMVQMFGQAPNDVRWGLMRSVGGHGDLLWQAVAA
ncbi:MAG: lycopene cyclase family protein [Synechococcales cyanobacterium RM1_1_8]|nr:lycopene cyclase family protein [Synechococcales cyanobacterium RM1_1_8]